ncbi:hypothetical protein DA075_35630 (plasmid) [Methylobacterium currus]|uniref:Uncharacterized protein n=1 Tax=Methylobacterium currus TaxID=2051553 RepID=A0A2R4WXE6_9HYPH|nr:hypothetical protein [Methylobacterium currus]AWB26202.1 hypothetical protein DA075_35630 [Methylobacterium currus]
MPVQSKPWTSPDVRAAELALDKLLSAIIAHDATRDQEPRGPIKATPFWFVSLDDAALAQAAFDELVRDPIHYALRHGVKRLGRELHRLGGLDAMSAAIDRVADMDPRHSGRRVSIMDSAWNGIGEGSARWWS